VAEKLSLMTLLTKSIMKQTGISLLPFMKTCGVRFVVNQRS
jgi:hypothetical protein